MSHPMRGLVLKRVSDFLDKEKVMRDLKTPLPSNAVILDGGPKCGTTWMLQILHGLRSNGSVDFESIYDVIPFMELAHMTGVDLRVKQQFQPPMFKTLAPFPMSPQSDKKIIITRDPGDAALSFYYFFTGFLASKEELDISEFVKLFIVDQGEDKNPYLNACQMRHLASWYPHRKDENVLWLHYEDLKADLKQCIKLISDFIGVGVGDLQLLARVEYQASLEFMKKHATKFDAKKVTGGYMAPELKGKGEGESSEAHAIIRKGQTNESRKVFSVESQQAIQQKWMEMLKPMTGYDSYAEMRAAINKELGRSFSAPGTTLPRFLGCCFGQQ